MKFFEKIKEKAKERKVRRTMIKGVQREAYEKEEVKQAGITGVHLAKRKGHAARTPQKKGSGILSGMGDFAKQFDSKGGSDNFGFGSPSRKKKKSSGPFF